MTIHCFKQSECHDFITRCIKDIEFQPDSVQAGLSSVLLQTISVTSKRLQQIVATDVFAKMLYDLVKNQTPEMRHIAYLTVLTSLTTKAVDSVNFMSLFEIDELNSNLMH